MRQMDGEVCPKWTTNKWSNADNFKNRAPGRRRSRQGGGANRPKCMALPPDALRAAPVRDPG
jgi:hypothetical protein